VISLRDRNGPAAGVCGAAISGKPEARGRVAFIGPAGLVGDDHRMPIASPARYAGMLDAARAGGYAYPAINVTSSVALNAAIRGFAEAGSDGRRC
jgi:hypothetical protein